MTCFQAVQRQGPQPMPEGQGWRGCGSRPTREWIGSQAPVGPDVANSMGSMLGLLLQDLLRSGPCRHRPLSLPPSVRLLFLPHLCRPVHSSWLLVLRSGCLAAPQCPIAGGKMSMPGPATRVMLPTKCAASCDGQQTHGWGSQVCASGPAPALLLEPSVPKCKGPACYQGPVEEPGHSALPSSTLLPMDILYSFTADLGTWLTLPHSPKPTVIPGNFNIHRMTQDLLILDLLASNSLHCETSLSLTPASCRHFHLSPIEQKGVSVKSSPHFNPDPDAETLYKAMKGIGTNEQAIIDVLTQRSNAQRQQIAKSFNAQFGKDLTETLKSELSSNFERLIIALMYPPYRYEAKELYDAMKGLGTREGVIIEILASRTKNQLQEIMKAYEEDYGSSLEEDIQADTSGYLERILVCLLQGSRDDLGGFVDPGLALQDAQDLYTAGEKICGTDEMKFISILCTRSATHLMRVFEEYEKIASKSIEDSIKSETHGSLEEAMLTVVKCTRNLHSYFAERLYYAMKGAGTHDGTLIRNIVSRSEIDLNLIKCQFKEMYGKTLSSMIMEDTSSDYKNALLNLVGSDP
eukprot:bmy_21975T0